MISKKSVQKLVCLAIILLVAAVGCQEQVKTEPSKTAVQSAEMALQFTPNAKSTYKSIMMTQMSLSFEGSISKEESLEDSKNEDKAEIVFTQEILSVDEQGVATAKITFESIKFTSIFKNDVTMAFDSTTGSDQGNPLGKLIGKSYNIKINSQGKVIGVTDKMQAARSVRGGSRSHKAAQKLLDSEVVKERHTIFALPADGAAKTDVTWSKIKKYEFPIVGPRAYERIYTLNEVKNVKGRKIAIVKMEAIPSVELPDGSAEEQAAIDSISKMFDSSDDYTGTLEFDLTNGVVEKYEEELKSEWLMVDPAAKAQQQENPDAVRMGTVRLRSLEKLN